MIPQCHRSSLRVPFRFLPRSPEVPIPAGSGNSIPAVRGVTTAAVSSRVLWSSPSETTKTAGHELCHRGIATLLPIFYLGAARSGRTGVIADLGTAQTRRWAVLGVTFRGAGRWMQPCSAAWDCKPGNAWLSTFIVVAI